MTSNKKYEKEYKVEAVKLSRKIGKGQAAKELGIPEGIEPFPIRVTTKRLLQVQHYGDVNMLNGAELPPVDIITFGSPCTDLSVAGKRGGLNAEHSGLFFQAVRIIKEMRCATNGKYPRFIVWENVPYAHLCIRDIMTIKTKCTVKAKKQRNEQSVFISLCIII